MLQGPNLSAGEVLWHINFYYLWALGWLLVPCQLSHYLPLCILCLLP